MELELREYQKNEIKAIRESFRNGHKRVVSVLPCGAGKTVLFAYMSKRHISISPSHRVLFLVHRRELIDQTVDTFRRFGLESPQIEIAMAQTVTRHLDTTERPTMMVMDECFVADTEIATDQGYRKIKYLQRGGLVASYNHKTKEVEYRRITHLFKNRVHDLVKVRIEGGTELVCTKNHPFYTNEGYAEAIGLFGKNVLLQDLRQGTGSENYEQIGEGLDVPQGIRVLLPGVPEQEFIADDVENESQIRVGENEEKQSDEKPKMAYEAVGYIEGDGLASTDKGRQRNRVDDSSGNAFERFEGDGEDVLCGISVSNRNSENHGVSDVLQGGYCDSGRNDLDRVGREFPQMVEETGTRQKERRIPNWKRVESVEVLEPGSFGRYSDGFVYNIEVEGNNNYFASGILVHNCHHASAKTWTNILERFPDVPTIGLTATPCRLDGRGLGDLFDDMHVGITPKELTKLGYLAPYDYYAPRVNIVDSSWKPRGSDFDMEDAAATLQKAHIFGDVEKYIDLNRQTIVYCPTVAMSRETAYALGPAAVHFDGDTPKRERDDIVRRFRSGEIRVLCNCDLIGEGFDVPDCDCVMLLRPTKSVSLYIQQSMRCLRPKDGKRAIIYDFVGNCYRHGLPTDDREWTLEGRMKCRNPSGEPAIAARQCGNCFLVYPGHDRICPYCGHDNGKTRAEIQREEAEELRKIEELERRNDRIEQGRAETYDQLVAIAMKRNYKNPRGWAWMVMTARRGRR